MKTVEEFYKEIAGSKELQAELKASYDEALERFLKKHGCDSSAKEFAEIIRTQGEISDDDAEAVAGGRAALACFCPNIPL